MRSSWIRVGLTPMTGVLTERGNRGYRYVAGEPHVTEAGIEAIYLQAKEYRGCWQPLKVKKRQARILPGAIGGSPALLAP